MTFPTTFARSISLRVILKEETSWHLLLQEWDINDTRIIFVTKHKINISKAKIIIKIVEITPPQKGRGGARGDLTQTRKTTQIAQYDHIFSEYPIMRDKKINPSLDQKFQAIQQESKSQFSNNNSTHKKLSNYNPRKSKQKKNKSHKIETKRRYLGINPLG